MLSFGSRSDDDLDPDYELALRIALERSKVETRDSGPSRSARSSGTWPAQSAPPLRRLLAPSVVAPPRGQRWVLVPVTPARTRTPESEACAARRERQRQRERSEMEQSVRRSRGIDVEPDDNARLLEWVYRRSLTTAVTVVRQF
ncbi:hypothetical protein D1007_22211 [Hordeum vulgare]|nr:hypothetical protein D1007_22211 [Hordeum vulgare]